MGWRTRIYRLGRRCYPVRKLAVCIGSTSKPLLLMASMGCCCAKPTRLDVTSCGPNFVELFFCQLRCMHLLPEKVPRPAIDHVGCDNRASYRCGHEY